MSIKALIATLVVALSLPFAGEGAEGMFVVKRADQLVESDRLLRAYEQPYILASSANLIYDTCAPQLKITDAERAYFKNRYSKLSESYLQEFERSFSLRWLVPSNEELSKDYVRYMNDLRTPAIARTSKSIAKTGCAHKSLKKIVDYYRKIEAAEKKGQPVPLVPVIKKRYN